MPAHAAFPSGMGRVLSGGAVQAGNGLDDDQDMRLVARMAILRRRFPRQAFPRRPSEFAWQEPYLLTLKAGP